MKRLPQSAIDVINRDRHIGKFGDRSEAREASKRVIYTLYYLIIADCMIFA
jgi:hypothetical protein